MTTELKMPALSPTMEKGLLAKWLVAEGAIVKAGDLLAEIETDKATMEYEAPGDGRIAKLLIAEGADDVAVGSVIALLADEGESLSVAVAPEPAESASLDPSGRTIDTSAVLRPLPSDRIKISPLAARVARARGIDLSALPGTGPNGRIVRADLDAFFPSDTPVPSRSADAAMPAPPPEGVPVETMKLTAMRKTIARRLSESKRTVPHFYLTARCNLDALLWLRSDLNAGLAPRDIRLSVHDMLMKALALALVEVPDAHVQFGGDVVHRFGRVDLSMAVAVDGGLVTPVIKGVESLSLSAIAQAGKALAAKARAGTLIPAEYQGGTASISNLGMFGIDEIVPVLNPPQALILGVGAGIEQPWKVDGQIALATVMAATGSFDHRVIDGAVAARFMQAFRDLVEKPLQLLA